MPKRKVTFTQGECYHIYNRGLDGNNIFNCKENYFYLLTKIVKISTLCQMDIIAYCLMPNHYHFLLYQTALLSKIKKG